MLSRIQRVARRRGGGENINIPFAGNILLKDDFSSSSIDASKWDIINPDPDKVSFSTEKGLLTCNTYKSSTSALFFANRIESKATFDKGVVRFQLSNLRYSISSTYVMAGIYVNSINRVQLINNTNGFFDFMVIVGGSIVYSKTLTIPFISEIKIVFALNGDVICYYLRTNQWYEIGRTNANIGTTKKVYLSARNVTTAELKMQMSDVYVTDIDYDTWMPDKRLYNNDIRNYGAIADMASDNASIINTLLDYKSVLYITGGIFGIGTSIKIPSNRKLLLENSCIKLLQNSFDNIIRNRDFTGNVNIEVSVNRGFGILHQNAFQNNDTSARTTWGTLNENSYHYLGVFFLNTTGLKLSGYTLHDYCAWGHLIQRCSNGVIDGVIIDYKTSIYNQDGIDIGHGTHDFVIKNVSGKSLDDFIAMVDWGRGTFVYPNYVTGGSHDISISDINGSQDGSGNFIRILAGDGGSIKNINIKNIVASSSRLALLHIGLDSYPTVKPSKGDISTISCDNIRIDAILDSNGAAIYIDSSCSNIIATNVTNNSIEPISYVNRTNRTVEGVYVNGIEI